jgi:hypothetical protein
MRDFKGIKRQRNRNRNGGGGGGGGGGKPQNNVNRAFDSNGPEGVKVRGAAQHVYEKYVQLARDASTSGDRVLAENHLQHAEHYFRVLRAMQPQRPLSDIIGRDPFSSGFDIDFEDENPEVSAGETEVEAGESEPSERPEGWRESRPREEWRAEGERSGYERPQGRERFRDQRRFDRPERGDRQDRGERVERPEQLPAPRAEADAPEPQGGPVLRADDGDVSYAPAFLQTRAPVAPETSEETPRPRRRRAPRDFSDAQPASESEDA